MNKKIKKSDPLELEDWHLNDDYYIPPTLDIVACLALWVVIGIGIVLEVLDK